MDDIEAPAAVNPPDREPDGLLASRIAGGDEDAFMDVYDRHADVLYGVVVRMLGDRETAADIVQETFLTLWRRASVFDPAAGNLRGWLIRIARNRTIDRLRADARRPRTARVAVGSEDDDNPLAALDRADPSTDDPERAFERGWTRAVVRTALTSVPPDERELLVLAYADGLSQSEIADRLGIPIGTVKSRTRRAMARLRDTLSSVPELTGQWQRMDV